MENGFELILHPDEDGGAEVYVQARIAGRPYELLLDTGAGATSLVWDEYTAALPAEGTHSSSGVLGDLQDDLVTVHDFKLGPIEKQTLLARRIPAGRGEARSLVGMDLLKDYCCTFRFEERRVSLDPQPPDGLEKLFLDARCHPYVPVTCAGETVPAVWDTGASLTCVDLGFIARHPEAFAATGSSGGTDASGNQVESTLYRVEGLTCGGREFPGHTVVGIDLSFVNSRIDHPMTMILGYSTLALGEWVMDFRGRRWGVAVRSD